MLTALHERFSTTACAKGESDEFRRGHGAGMAFARLCVLDYIAGATITPGAEPDPARRQRWELAALQTIGGRLAQECGSAVPADVDEFTKGYQAGMSTARTYIGLTHDALELRAGR